MPRPPLRPAAFLSLAFLAAAPPGCKHHEEDPPKLEPGMTPELLRADGERMVREGHRTKEEGLSLRQQGKGGGDDLIIRGEQMMADGEKMKDRAMMVK